MKTTVYSLLLGIHNSGTDVLVLPSRTKLDEECEAIMREAVADRGDSSFDDTREACKQLLVKLDAGDITGAWKEFNTDGNLVRREDDWYGVTEHTLEIDSLTHELEDADDGYDRKVTVNISGNQDCVTIGHTVNGYDGNITAELHMEMNEGVLIGRIFKDNEGDPAARIDLRRIHTPDCGCGFLHEGMCDE